MHYNAVAPTIYLLQPLFSVWFAFEWNCMTACKAGQDKARQEEQRGGKWGQMEAWFALSLSMLSLAFRSQRPDMHTISLQSQHTECVWQQSHSHSHCHTRISISTAISMPISILHFPYCKANTNTIRQMNKHTIQLG